MYKQNAKQRNFNREVDNISSAVIPFIILIICMILFYGFM